MKMFRCEREWADLLGRTVAPLGLLGGVVDHVPIGTLYDEECQASPWYAALVMRLSLWLTWFAPLWLCRRLCTMRSLSQNEREEILERLLHSPVYGLRMAVLFLKLSVFSVLLGNQETFRYLDAYRLAEPEELARLRRAR
jgi:hypothetical protein